MSSIISEKSYHLYLETFSKVYWLRPITAIWRSIEASYFSFDKAFLQNSTVNWIDLGVGDGIFSTVATGLPIPPNYDAYKWVKEPGQDNLDLDGRPDFFDCPPDKKIFDLDRLNLKRYLGKNSLKTPWALGIDHKLNLLLKAKKLGTFKELRVASFNDPNILFKDHEFFDLCFSNSIYWSKNPSAVLEQVRNHIKESNQISLVLSLQLPNYRKYREDLLGSFGPMYNFFDKGRKEHYQAVYNVDEWTNMIEASGFQIVDNYFLANKNLVNSIEWLDNRELYPYYAKALKQVKFSDRIKIRKDFSNYIKTLGRESFRNGIFNATKETASYLLLKAKTK